MTKHLCAFELSALAENLQNKEKYEKNYWLTHKGGVGMSISQAISQSVSLSFIKFSTEKHFY
jgi:hypothetical protein